MFNLNILSKTITNPAVVPFGGCSGTINAPFSNPVVVYNPINGYSIVERGVGELQNINASLTPNSYAGEPLEYINPPSYDDNYGGRYNEWDNYGGRYNEWDEFDFNISQNTTSAPQTSDSAPQTSEDDKYVLEVYSKLYQDDKLIQFLFEKVREFNDKRGAMIYITLAGGMFRDPILKSEVQDYDVFMSGHLSRAFIVWFNEELAKSEFCPKDLEEDNTYHGGFKSVKYTFDGDTPSLNIVSKAAVVSFNADISKLGITFDSKGEVYQVFSEGIQAIRDRKVILSLHVSDEEEYSAQSLHRYARKLLLKPWANQFTFELQVTGDVEYTEVWQHNDLSEESFYAAHTTPVETLLCLLEFGLFSVWKEGQAETFVKTVRNFHDRLFNEALQLVGPSVRFRLDTADYVSLWLEGYIREGGAYDVIRAGHPSISGIIVNGIKDETYMHYNVLRGRASAETLDLGWDIMSHLSVEAQCLLVEGKKRLAFSYRDNGYSSAALRQYYRAIGFGKVLEAYECPKNVFTADVRVFLGKPGFTPKQAISNARYTTLDFSKVLGWSTVLGEASLLLDRYWINHADLVREVNIPRSMVKTIAINHRLMSWVFEHSLDVDWSVSKSPKVCIIKAIMLVHGVDNKAATVIYDNPGSIQAIEFSKVNDNSNVIISKSFPNNRTYTSSCGKYVLEMLSKTSLDNLIVGEYTSCCQHLEGAGRTVCIDGWLDPYSVNYVIKSIDSGLIYSHFWMWESQEGLLVLDSLEGRSDNGISSVTLELVKAFINTNTNIAIGNTGYGFTSKLINDLGLSLNNTVKCPTPYIAYRYMDASGGVFLTNGCEGWEGGTDRNLIKPVRLDINEDILDSNFIQEMLF